MEIAHKKRLITQIIYLFTYFNIIINLVYLDIQGVTEIQVQNFRQFLCKCLFFEIKRKNREQLQTELITECC